MEKTYGKLEIMTCKAITGFDFHYYLLNAVAIAGLQDQASRNLEILKLSNILYHKIVYAFNCIFNTIQSRVATPQVTTVLPPNYQCNHPHCAVQVNQGLPNNINNNVQNQHPTMSQKSMSWSQSSTGGSPYYYQINHHGK
jgi:hypothetical protein